MNNFENAWLTYGSHDYAESHVRESNTSLVDRTKRARLLKIVLHHDDDQIMDDLQANAAFIFHNFELDAKWILLSYSVMPDQIIMEAAQDETTFL